MQFIERSQCVISGNEDLEHLHTFANFPIFMGCVDNNIPESDLLYNMSWWISKSSGCIQLKRVPDLNLIYPTSHGSGTIGTIWESHHTELANFIQEYKGHDVLEIGGGHGFLANYILERDEKCFWTLIDPNPTCPAKENLTIIKGFFPVDMIQTYDTIVHSHLFEHILEPEVFCREIRKSLKDGGHLVFSVPNLGEMFSRKYTNILNFEHTYFLSEYYTSYLLQKEGFELVSKSYFKEDHSIFYSFRKCEITPYIELESQYSTNSKLFKNYINHHLLLISNFNQLMQQSKGNIFLFGGHAMSQFLLAFGLAQERIKCVIDNDQKKWDTRLNGTNLQVFSPEILRDEVSPIVILRAGAFQSEITTQLKQINRSVIIPQGILNI